MKIGFLFGAGAEISYGMPTGGTFALDIFRENPKRSKEKFKQIREKIDPSTAYANNWLPGGFIDKNIGTFGRSVFENIIKDTVEHNRNKIINSLNNFDTIAEQTLNSFSEEDKTAVLKAITNITGRSLGNMSMGQIISYREEFKQGNNLFTSKYFSALLFAYKSIDKITNNEKSNLGKTILAIMQLQIGALSETLASQINDSPFSKKDEDIDLFDDLGDIIQLNHSLTGVSGLNYLLELPDLQKKDNGSYVVLFAQKLLEKFFSNVLDYKSLIDSNWHYLYCPRTEWSKFCKINIFLLTVRQYILDQCQNIDSNKKGYYDDLSEYEATHDFEVSAIATTNYTNLIKNRLASFHIYFLNGSTELWYDPYINVIGSEEELDKEEIHFKVPLMFTQSGTKPMTSIYMSKAYVNAYDAFDASDVICSIGFGYNPDDEHINGLIRDLINKGKKLFIVLPKENNTIEEERQNYADKLKTIHAENIFILQCDSNRQCDGKMWLEHLFDQYEALKSQDKME